MDSGDCSPRRRVPVTTTALALVVRVPRKDYTGTAGSFGVRTVPADRHLRYAAAGFAYLVAGLHLFHPQRGFPRLVLILGLEDPVGHLLYDPRPLLFVLSAVVIVTGIKLVLLGAPRRPIYLLGMLLVATYFLGYFAWHLTGHGGFLPGRIPNYHGLGPVEAVVDHLRAYAWARWTKVAEAILLALLAVLYRRESGE